MVLGELPVPGRPTHSDYGRERAYCTCSRCGWGIVWTFFLSSIISLFPSPSLWETARYRLKYCLEGPLSPQTTNQKPTESTSSRLHRPLIQLCQTSYIYYVLSVIKDNSQNQIRNCLHVIRPEAIICYRSNFVYCRVNALLILD